MRASGSDSVSFESVRLPAERPARRLPDRALRRELHGAEPRPPALFHAATGVGIAESAHESVARRDSRAAATWTAARAMLAGAERRRAGSRAGPCWRAPARCSTTHATGELGRRDEDGVTALFAEVQAAKAFINEAAVRIVDRALALTGGAGYLSRHPLSRAYRDVRAGAFMHPLGANRAFDLLADVALGREPSLR